MAQSTQKKLDRVRTPKVQIKYDVESYDGVEKCELPFVMGVMADLSGDNAVVDKEEKAIKVKDRHFVNLDGDEFDTVLKAAKPRVQTNVVDTLSGKETSTIMVDMTFESLDDFSPQAVAEKVEPIQKLVEARRRLASLKQKMDGHDELEQLVTDILTNTELRGSIKGAVADGSLQDLPN